MIYILYGLILILTVCLLVSVLKQNWITFIKLTIVILFIITMNTALKDESFRSMLIKSAEPIGGWPSRG
ncbi:hypothetical protein [Priestia megaterium]|uniref:hypothetical protein n=1 Tax=Priestia megaterium TaxID=1404 RepID=UPI00366D8296